MAAGIPTGFVRKLYRILDHESSAIIAWDAGGASFSVLDAERLNAQVLPRYFRGRMSAFRRQLADHGFRPLEAEDDGAREAYAHEHFRRGCPERLSRIERVPKGKRRRGADDAPGSLQVTLTAVKRPGPPPKRVRADADADAGAGSSSGGPAANPLFSPDPSDAGAALARLVDGGGLLPASSELPDPISYLSRAGGGHQPAPVPAPSSTAGASARASAAAPAFSDDLVRSALYFLVSTSVTGAEDGKADGSGASASASSSGSGPGSTSASGALSDVRADALAALLASSTSAAPGGGGGIGGAWAAAAGASNPLFSDQSAGDEDEGENSIWSLLVASSVDRVKSAIGDVADPQAKLRLIVAERERLEAQRSKVGVPAVPVRPTAHLDSSGLFARATTATAATSARTTSAAAEAGPSEDDLWRLLMSSSIDVFRGLEQRDV